MYKPEERNIYEFWDGSQERAVDPVRVLMTLKAQEGLDLEADLARLESGDLDAMAKSNEVVVGAVHAAFGTEPFGRVDGEQKGLLDVEALQLLRDFLGYAAGLAKKNGQTPTSPLSTDSDAGQTTKPSSASG